MSVSREKPKRGDLYAAALGGAEGSEQRGSRPVLIVSNDLFNEAVPLVTIVPLTTLRQGRRVHPSEVRISKGTTGLRADSLALCHQVRTIARSRLGRRVGEVDGASMSFIAAALRLHFAL
jgi:mRNA interferase MazF